MKGLFVIVYLFAALSGTLATRGETPLVAIPAGPATPAGSAAATYAKYCVSCHGRDGRSRTAKAKRNHARNLADLEWQNRVSDERIFNSIMNGKGRMPEYSKKLSEQEIEALVSYVRAFRQS